MTQPAVPPSTTMISNSWGSFGGAMFSIYVLFLLGMVM